jgi:hypothetical protein
MIDFNKFWVIGNSPYADDDGESPEEGDSFVPPGVSADEILNWEQFHGVSLPEPIRTALCRRNGGFVRSAPIQILPLNEMVPVDDDFWEHTDIDEEEAPDHNLMFVFGYEMEVGGTYLMNFNAIGPRGAPSVYLDFHGEQTQLINKSLNVFFEKALASDAHPSVNWSEAERSATVIARETIDISSLHKGKRASQELVLLREGKTLVLFSRLRSPEGETLARTVLPLPLDSDWAEIDSYRPAPIGSFGLHLQPQDDDGIVQHQSTKDADGKWKNSTSRGVPIYVTFESKDRDRLRALRAQLLGDELADQAEAFEDEKTEVEGLLDKLTPDQRTAALLQAALKMREEADRLFRAKFGDALPQTPGLADAADAMRLRLDQISDQVRQQSAANPPDPEIQRKIEEHFRRPSED